MTFQKKIIEAVKKSGLSDTDFRKKLGISHATLWRWKTGKCKPIPEAVDYWLVRIELTRF